MEPKFDFKQRIAKVQQGRAKVVADRQQPSTIDLRCTLELPFAIAALPDWTKFQLI
jgi:hypothetical protein